ncbi:MAG TPA: AAA family ATPase [Polyangiaceae bacterium]|nr:AAA family ATPase [Polyangiaceae bacterium]
MDPLFGRRSELAALVSAFERAEQGHGSLAVLSGEAGIGKSRLMRELAAHANERGSAVAWGRAWEAGGAPTFWPWTQVFRALECDPFESFGGAPDASQRFALFDQAAQVLARAAREKPHLVLLDDLHAADVPSLLLLLFVAREISGMRVLLVGATRETHAYAEPEVAGLLAKVRREALVVPLPRLTGEEVVAWATARSAANAERIFSMSEGNPLFVEELLRVGLSPGALPSGLSAVLDEHLSRLSPRARSTLDAAAVLGREFSVEALAASFGLSPDEVAEDANEATTAGILTASEHGTRVFSHALLRDRLYDRLPPTRRAELHWQAGLANIQGVITHATAAYHLLEGCAAGQWQTAALTARDAAEAALIQFGYEEAAALAQRALSVVERGTAIGCELELVRAEALIRIGSAKEGRALCRSIALIAAELPSPELIAKAALVYGTEFMTAAVDNQMVELLRLGLERLPKEPSALRVRVMARLSAALTPPVDEEGAREILDLMRTSLAMAREVGDKQAILFACTMATQSVTMMTFEERAALVVETVALARELGQRLILARMSGLLIALLIEQGRRAEANVELRAFEDLIGELPKVHRWRLPAVQSVLALLDGRRDDAVRLSDESNAGALEGSPAHAVWGLQRMAISQAFGDPAAIVPDAAEMLRIGIGKRGTQIQAWVLAALEKPVEARAALEASPGFERGFPTGLFAGAACVLAQDAELSARVYPSLQAESAHNQVFWGLSGSSFFGPTSRVLGDLALLLGRRDEAVAHYNDAVEHCRRMGAKPLLALSLEGLRACGKTNVSERPLRSPQRLSVRREGELWLIESNGAEVRVKHSKGIVYLEQLVLHVGRELHVLVLVGADQGASDAGEILDTRAKAEYQRRLELVDAELEQARSLGDDRGVARARTELDALAEQLAAAVGLGGRDRRAASNVERARINVQRRLKDTIDSVSAADAALGRYLQATVKTGTFCSFMPL